MFFILNHAFLYLYKGFFCRKRIKKSSPPLKKNKLSSQSLYLENCTFLRDSRWKDKGEMQEKNKKKINKSDAYEEAQLLPDDFTSASFLILPLAFSIQYWSSSGWSSHLSSLSFRCPRHRLDKSPGHFHLSASKIPGASRDPPVAFAADRRFFGVRAPFSLRACPFTLGSQRSRDAPRAREFAAIAVIAALESFSPWT